MVLSLIYMPNNLDQETAK